MLILNKKDGKIQIIPLIIKTMDEALKFLKNNVFSIVIGLFVYTAYLFFTYSGNRICDCETTEKYSSGQTLGQRPINTFYHK